MSLSEPPRPPRVLVVDDNRSLLESFARVLRANAFCVSTAESGTDALTLVRAEAFDAVLTDIAMPKMSGVVLVKAIREHDLDVPVVLMTGEPSIDSAAKAVEYGAYKYLTKPVPPKSVVSTLRQATSVCRVARARRAAATELGANSARATDLAGLEMHLDRALSSLWMVFQPIMSRDGKVFGYEALLRTDDAAFPDPPALLSAAEQLGRVHEVGRVVRQRTRDALTTAPDAANIFVNLHPHDLLDEELRSPSGALADVAPRIVFEVTERASLNHVPGANDIIAVLREQGYKIAVDDLGAGYAGLNTLATLEPDIVKLDMLLVRDVHLSKTKSKLIKTVTGLCTEMDIVCVAEGVENEAEESQLLRLGCDLFQGYLYARPGRPFPVPQRTPRAALKVG